MTKLNMLSVDDNAADQRLIALAFEASGSDTDLHLVRNGDEAISYLMRKGDYAQASRPDLILLDLNLPKLSGREVLAMIRSTPKLQEIPVVVFTGAKTPLELATRFDIDRTVYAVKPDGVEAFFAAVAAIESYGRKMVAGPEACSEHAQKLRESVAA